MIHYHEGHNKDYRFPILQLRKIVDIDRLVVALPKFIKKPYPQVLNGDRTRS